MEVFKLIFTVIFCIAIQFINIYLVVYEDLGFSFVLGVEALALTILGCSFISRRYLQISITGKGDIDMVNVLALAVSFASVYTPWAVGQEKTALINGTYAFLGGVGLLFIAGDIYYNYRYPKKSHKTYDSTTVVIEEGSTTTVVTKYKVS